MKRQTINNLILLAALFILSLLFFNVISRFFTVLVMASVFAVMSQPIYKYFLRISKKRPNLSAALTITSISLLIFVPMFTLIGVVADQAINVSQKVRPWVTNQIENPGLFNDYLSLLHGAVIISKFF